ncbi:MAG TPA: PAS domain S-box protein [Chitinophagaceae bacterium]|nr:PAS domain S-box protein [Chitinophagaceae bacterium]
MQEPGANFYRTNGLAIDPAGLFDWHKTPLGDPANWPENLRLAITGWLTSPGDMPLIALSAAEEETQNKFLETEQKLAESEDRLRVALEAAELGTWDLHLNPPSFFYSSRLLQIFGYKEYVQLNHQDFRDHVHPDDLPTVVQAHMDAVTSGVLAYEVRITWKNGTEHWIRCNGKTLYNSSNEPVRMIGTIMDITERKSLEKKLERKVEERTGDLKRSEEQRHKMIDEIQDYAILLLNKEGIIQNWNKGAEKIKGYKEEEIVGKSFKEFYTVADRQNKIPEKLIAIAAENGRAEAEGWRVRKDGGKFWGSTVITALHDNDNNIIGFTKITRDLTEKKITEEQTQLHANELKIKNAELSRQKAFVDIILDSSIDVISVFDREQRYITVNRSMEETYNVKREEILGKTLLELFPAEATIIFRDSLAKAFAGETIRGLIHKSVITGKHYESFFVPLKNNEEVYAVLAIAHDNTGILETSLKLEKTNKVLEEKTIELEKANSALEKSNGELEQYAYVASHDLQEPLRKIRTYSGILNETLVGKGDNESVVILQKVINSATRMSNLIYDLLNFSRLLNPEKQFEETDLNQIFKNILSDFELVTEQRKAVIQIDKLPVIQAVPLQMNQLFYNLISNALKFCREGNQPAITVNAKIAGKEICKNLNLNGNLSYFDITVSDNGIGFSQQYAEQIFEVFKRLHTKKAYQGSGIGLALCRRIAVNHQGDIFAEGKENKGSIFHVLLPVQQS